MGRFSAFVVQDAYPDQDRLLREYYASPEYKNLYDEYDKIYQQVLKEGKGNWMQATPETNRKFNAAANKLHRHQKAFLQSGGKVR